MRLRTNARRGFTLLELVLALAIAILMMAALYVAMDVQLREMDEGRNRVEQSAVARGLFNRISNDLTSSLAPIAATNTSTTPSTGATADATMTDADTGQSTTPLAFGIG